MRRGMTLIELLTGMGLVMLLIVGSMNLFAGSLRSLQRTTNDVTMEDQNARALRKMTETMRSAMSVTISNNGNTVTFNLPKLSSTSDPVTGEKEYIVPPVSDGVNRSYTVHFDTGTVTDNQATRVMIQNVASTDPDPNSTNYHQAYVPFQITSIGVYKGITINLITLDKTSGQSRVVRMKTTMILKNS